MSLQNMISAPTATAIAMLACILASPGALLGQPPSGDPFAASPFDDPFGTGASSPGADPINTNSPPAEVPAKPATKPQGAGATLTPAPSESAAAPAQVYDPFASRDASDPFAAAGAPQQSRSQQPVRRSFRIELIEVAEDQLSVNKFLVAGNVTVIPQGADALPEVKVDGLRTVQSGTPPGAPYGDPNPYSGGYDGGMGTSMDGGSMYGMGMEGGMPTWTGTPAQRQEVERRITWQTQVSWVQTTLQSASGLADEEVEKWKQLIKPVLRSQYLDQMRRQKLQLSVVEKRLEQMNAQLARRAAAVDSVVEFELRRLELQAGGIGMLPDASLQPPLSQSAPGSVGMAPGFDSGFE